LWIEIILERFLKGINTEELIVRYPNSNFKSLVKSEKLDKGYIWAGRLRRGKFFPQLIKKFPEKLSEMDWDDK
jgi:hypothetical protein